MMSDGYTVFARKYRAQNFDEIIGQQHVVKTLKNAILSGNIGHAYLFAGPRGVGKTSMARIFAKSLNCEKGPTINPCNQCNLCAMISKGNSLDVVEIDGASHRRIDDIRDLIEQLKYPPVSGKNKKKIYIIDEVHMLTTEAFNALLKSLEEPPKYVIFIFATTEPFKVPPTILSRCQRFDFRRIPLQKISLKLKEIGKIENINAANEVYSYIAMQSEGSLRDAEVMFDQLNSFSDGNITMEIVQNFLGVVGIDWIMKVIKNVFEKNAAAAIGTINELYNQGLNLRDFLLSFLKVLRDLVLIFGKYRSAETILYFPEENYKKYLELFKDIDADLLLSFMRLIEKTYNTIRYSDSGNLEVEIMAADLIQLYEIYDLNELITYAEAAKIKQTVYKSVNRAKTEDIKAEGSQSIIINDENYNAFCNWVKASNKNIYERFLSDTFFDRFDNNTVYIYIEGIQKFSFRERKAADWEEVNVILRKFFNEDKLKISVDWAQSKYTEGGSQKKGIADEVTKTIPDIKLISDAFNGKITIKRKEE
jgi:DNA polymerase-3 subunit gamma/tau